jgi:hypothetical protein
VVEANVRWIGWTRNESRKGAVSWLSNLNPEAQATIIVGILTVVAQPVFLLVAFFLGKAQGKAQVRHEKAAEAIVAALRIIRRLQLELGVWALSEKQDELELDQAKKVSRLRDELRRLIYDNSPWFEPQTEGKMKPILAEVRLYYKEHTDALKSGDAARIAESGKRLSEWHMEPLTLMANALEDEARRLIGTKIHWRSTRRGRFILWVRQNPGWLAAVPLPILFVILVSIVVFLLVAP